MRTAEQEAVRHREWPAATSQCRQIITATELRLLATAGEARVGPSAAPAFLATILSCNLTT
jgi:hypothetical protein